MKYIDVPSNVQIIQRSEAMLEQLDSIPSEVLSTALVEVSAEALCEVLELLQAMVRTYEQFEFAKTLTPETESVQ